VTSSRGSDSPKEMLLENPEGKLAQRLRRFSGHEFPNATASKAVTGRAITSFVMTSWPAAFPSRTRYEARADFASRPKGDLIRRYGKLLSGKLDKSCPDKPDKKNPPGGAKPRSGPKSLKNQGDRLRTRVSRGDKLLGLGLH